MRKTLLSILAFGFILPACAAEQEHPLPMKSGEYGFSHKYTEHPNMVSVRLTAEIEGNHIRLINNDKSDVFPKGVVEEGILMWHEKSKQWIIGSDKNDVLAKEVGGCSDGPSVVDLAERIYWTC
jgi:hypothetical protein